MTTTLQHTLPGFAAGPDLAHPLRRMGTAIWQSLERSGRQRAARQILSALPRIERERPEQARELRAIANGWLAT